MPVVPAELVRLGLVDGVSVKPAAHLMPPVFESCRGDCCFPSADVPSPGAEVPFVPSAVFAVWTTFAASASFVPLVASTPLESTFSASWLEELTDAFLITLFGDCGGCA